MASLVLAVFAHAVAESEPRAGEVRLGRDRTGHLLYGRVIRRGQNGRMVGGLRSTLLAEQTLNGRKVANATVLLTSSRLHIASKTVFVVVAEFVQSRGTMN